MRLTKHLIDDDYLMVNNSEEECLSKLGQLEDIEEEFQIDNLDDLRERLKTYKFLANHEMSCVDVEGYNCMFKDLKEYHNIEKELGIDLITLFKALKDGIWSKEHLTLPNKYCRQRNPFTVRPVYLQEDWKFAINPSSPCADSEFGPAHIFWDYVKLKDYGKTWALTKEELL